MSRKLLAFSVRDYKAEAFIQPFFVGTKGVAIRIFTDAANDSGHEFAKHAEDYGLFHIGEFDQASGSLTPLLPPELVVNGLDVKTPQLNNNQAKLPGIS